MKSHKNCIPKTANRENVRVIIPAAPLLSLLLRYRQMTFPAVVTIREKRGGRLFFLRSRKELQAFLSQSGDLHIAYFGVIRGEVFLDLATDAEIEVKTADFRKARNGACLTERETLRFFLLKVKAIPAKA